jgi:hypothetical protein
VSHELIFLPHLLGQTWREAHDAAAQAAASSTARLDAARLTPWPHVVLRAADILGQVDDYRGPRHCELAHPATGLRLTLYGTDGRLTLPYWYDGTVARKVCDMANRLARAVEDETGLAAFDTQQGQPLSAMAGEEFLRGYLAGRDRYLSLFEQGGET